MDDARSGRRGRVALLALLAAGWLLGGAIQVATRALTGYMDVLPPQLLLAVLLCVGAGAAARMLDPVRRTARRGALAGIGMVGSIVAAYMVLTAVLWNPTWAEQDGETWFSLLIEAPFWIGVPLLAGTGFGALGWWVADRVMPGRRDPSSSRRPGSAAG
jgi:hypothetical protein